MITLTVLQLLNATEPLQALYKSTALKGRASLIVRKLWRTAAPIIQDSVASRDTLFDDTNSTPIGDGRRVLKDGCLPALLDNPLFAELVELDCKPITPEVLADVEISPQHIDLLGPLFVE